MERAQLIMDMKVWCLENYYNGADTMVECWEDSDYDDLISRSGSDEDAWEVLKRVASIYAERQADAWFHREKF